MSLLAPSPEATYSCDVLYANNRGLSGRNSFHALSVDQLTSGADCFAPAVAIVMTVAARSASIAVPAIRTFRRRQLHANLFWSLE